MNELQDLIKFLKDKGLEHHKINVDVLCGIIEYFANKHETKQCNIADVSGLACKCGNQIFTHRHSNWIECTACNKIQILQAF